MRYWHQRPPAHEVNEYEMVWCITHGYPMKQWDPSKLECELIRLERLDRHIHGFDPCVPVPGILRIERKEIP